MIGAFDCAYGSSNYSLPFHFICTCTWNKLGRKRSCCSQCRMWVWDDEKEEFKHSGHIPFYIYISHFFSRHCLTEEKYVSLMMARNFPPLTLDVLLTRLHFINILHSSIHRSRPYLRPTGGFGIFSRNIGLVFLASLHDLILNSGRTPRVLCTLFKKQTLKNESHMNRLHESRMKVIKQQR